MLQRKRHKLIFKMFILSGKQMIGQCTVMPKCMTSLMRNVVLNLGQCKKLFVSDTLVEKMYDSKY